jgi:hypothetical protein
MRFLPAPRDLDEIGSRLDHPRIQGNRVGTSVCPVCGPNDKRRRASDRIFYVTETEPGRFVGHCHACHVSDQETISRALGLQVGSYRLDVIDNGDPGPFYPAALVLREVRRGELEVACDFGTDEIGRLANAVVWHLIPARRRAAIRDPRFQWLPEEAPSSVRFARDLLRKLGIRVGTDKAKAIRARIHETVENRWHYFPEQKAARLGFRGYAVFITKLYRSLKLYLRASINPALSCTRKGLSRARTSLERFLTTSISAHAPPAILNEPPRMTPALAAFLGQGEA